MVKKYMFKLLVLIFLQQKPSAMQSRLSANNPTSTCVVYARAHTRDLTEHYNLLHKYVFMLPIL